MNRLWAKISFKKNIGNYLLLTAVYILVFVCLLSLFNFQKSANVALEKTLLANSFNSHIVLQSNNNEIYFDESSLMQINDDTVKTVTGLCSFKNQINNKDILVVGIDINKIENLGIKLSSGTINSDKNSIYVSDSYAVQNSLSINSEIILTNKDKQKNFKINGICFNTAFFSSSVPIVLIDIREAQEFNCLENKINMAYVQLTNIEYLDETFLHLGQVFESTQIVASKLIDKEQYDFYVKPVHIILLVFTILTILIAITLTYYAMKKNVDKRIFSYGILISIGMSAKKIYLKLLIEAIIFTILVTLVGSCLGIGLISILLSQIIGVANLIFDWWSIIILSLIFLIFTISIISVLIYKKLKVGIVPLIKKIPDNKQDTHQNKYKTYIFGIITIILLSIGIGLYFVASLYVQIVGMIAFILGSLSFTIIFFQSLLWLMKIKSQNTCPKAHTFLSKAVSSIKTNKGNIVVLYILTITIAIVSITTPLLNKSLHSFYKNVDIIGFVRSSDIDLIVLKDKEKNVEDININYSAKQIINNVSISILGVDVEKYEKFSADKFNNSLNILIGNLERKVIVSSTYLKRENLNIGDKITIATKYGKKEYVIVDSYFTFDNQGNNFIINSLVFKQDFVNETTQLLIKLKDIKQVNSTIKNLFDIEELKNKASLFKAEDMIQSNVVNINSILMIVNLLIAVLVILSTMSWAMNVFLTIKSELPNYFVECCLGQSKNSIIKELLVIYIFIIGFLMTWLASVFAGIINFYIINIFAYTIGSFNYVFALAWTPLIIIPLIIAISLIVPLVKLKKKKLSDFKQEER